MPEPPVGGLSRGGTGCTEPSGLVVWGGTVSGEVDVREGEEEEGGGITGWREVCLCVNATL